MRNEEVSRSLGIVEGKCNLILSTLADHRKDIDVLYKKTSEEVRRVDQKVNILEKKQYTILALGGLLFTAGMTYINKFFV